MANPEKLEYLQDTAEDWNIYRHEHAITHPDLSEADLRAIDLTDSNPAHADLTDANLSGAFLLNANLSGANLAHVDLSKAVLTGVEGLSFNGT